MASPAQRKGACGHIMAAFDRHSRCTRCRDKGLGDDPCISKLPCEYCELLTPEQVIQLATPTYKLRKGKAQSKEILIDPSTVTVVAQVESQDNDPAISSHNSSAELALSQPSFCKELQELEEKWSVRMARLEALLTIGQCPASQPSFSPVKAPVTHKPPTGVLSQNPFLLPTVPSGQNGPAFGLDRTHTTTATTSSSVDMVSPLENLYQEPDPGPVFAQPASSGPVSSIEQCVEPLPVSYRDIIQSEQTEEGELSELEDQLDTDNTETDCAMSEDQNYWETVRGVRAFMGWSHIPDLEYSPTTLADNPWVGHRSQPIGKVSVLLPPEDWLCKKLENFNLVLIEGYPSKSSEPGGLHMDQYLHPRKSQSRWYGIHPAEPKDFTKPGKYVTTWPNDTAKLNNAFTRIAKSSATSSQQPSHPIAQDTLRKWEKEAKETSYICNQSAGFNHCITKIQDSVQEQLKILQTELGKGKSSTKAQTALDELHYLTTFNQNVSFAAGKSLQHLSDFTFVQMANLTLVGRDSYLEHLKPGVKPDTFSALRNCPLNTQALFPDVVIRKAEDEIQQFETLKRTNQPGPGRGGFAGNHKKQNRFQPCSTNWKQGQETAQTGGAAGKDMPAWKSFGGHGRSKGRERGGQPGRGTHPPKDQRQYK